MKHLFLGFFMAVTALTSQAASLNTTSSKVFWQGTKVTGRHYGYINIKSDTLKVSKGVITGGEIVIDMNSFQATDLQGEWKGKLETHLKSADFFNVKKYPTATLKVKKVEGYTITADLTIMGKTNEVVFRHIQTEKDLLVL